MRKSLARKFFNYYKGYLRSLYFFNRNYFSNTFEIIREHNLEKEFKIETVESNYFSDRFSSFGDGSPYQATSYGKLQKIINYLNIKPEDVFIDLGCGKGRVVFFFSRQKLKKSIGVDSNQELIDIAKKNLANFKLNNSPIEFINSDAANLQFKEETIFFMFNPFGAPTLKGVLKNIKDSLAVNPRSIHIIYYIPAHKHILNDQDWLVLEKNIDKGNCLIWRNKI